MQSPEFPHDKFDDLLAANSEYQKSFKYSDLTGRAQKGLAIVTCMDSRINPLSVVGMRSGDAKILRNAGARVTEDVLRTFSFGYISFGSRSYFGNATYRLPNGKI